MNLDAIIISDTGADTLSGTNPLKFKIGDRIGDIQVVQSYIKNQGRLVSPIQGDDEMSWASAPKLNGIYLLDLLNKNGFKAELIGEYYRERDKFSSLLKKNPIIVVVSTTFIHNKKTLFKLIADIRLLAPEVFIVVGGPFVYISYLLFQKKDLPSYDTKSAINDFLFLDCGKEATEVDLFVYSLSAERTLIEVIKRLQIGSPVVNLPGTAILKNKQFHFFPMVNKKEKITHSKIDWDLLPASVFKTGVVPVQASLGCPYKCAFCNFSKSAIPLYVKPLDDLIDELKSIAKRGVRYVWFVDDNFRLGKNDLDKTCQRFIDEKLNIKWMTFIRASTLLTTDPLLLKQSGCIEVQLGLESADSGVLRNMNKKANSSLYANVIKNLLAVGINCSCYFIFGFPGETEASANKTRNFIESIESPELPGQLSWSAFPFILSPLSPIYENKMRKKFGLSGYLFEWQHDSMNSEEARGHVKRTFYEMENSGPIYRGDNLDILNSLSEKERKAFYRKRHHLSKLATRKNLSKTDIIDGFKGIF